MSQHEGSAAPEDQPAAREHSPVAHGAPAGASQGWSDAPRVEPGAPQGQPGAGQDRFLLAIVAGTALLVVVSIAVVLLFGRARPAPPADPSSPAGVVQSYVEATRNGDQEKARTFLTREARAEALARDRQNPGRPSIDDNVRIVVNTVSTTDTTAEVKLTISRFYARSDPFSSNTSHYDITVKLLREDGEWRISQPVEPFGFY